VYAGRIAPFDEVRFISVAGQQLLELCSRDPGEHGRVGDLVAVQVQDRQHRTVVHGIEELVGVPARGEGARLRLAVADHAGGDEIGVVEDRTERVRQRVAQLTALVDRSRRLGRDVARNPARKRDLNEKPLHPFLVLRNVRIHLRVGAFQIHIRHESRAAMARAGDVDDVQVVGLDDAIQVDIDEVQTRRRAPVPEQARLDVLDSQRRAKQRVVEQVDLPDRQVVRRAPVGVNLAQLIGGQRVSRRASLARPGCAIRGRGFL
jgi:hypothetical protein